jgi:dipeptidyl aminopeptidase/acylaminoacyl peptidase
MTSHTHIAVATALLCVTATATALAAAPQPLDNFARRPQMQGVSISADGKYVAFLSGSGDDTLLMTYDRTVEGSKFKRVTTSEPEKFDIGWCRWANPKRLICGLYGNFRGKKYAEPPFTRMFAVDGDGAALKALDQSKAKDGGNLLATTTSMRNLNMNQGAHVEKSEESMYTRMGDGAGGVIFNNAAVRYVPAYATDRQDQVIDFTPDDDDSVLIQFDDDKDSYNSIFRLNIQTGAKVPYLLEQPPIRNFITDGRGNARIGWGSSLRSTTQYFARLDGENEWRSLGATNAFSETNPLRPIAIAAAANSAYAVGNHEGRSALWMIDLTDKAPPKLVFHHPLVDMGEPIFRGDRRLLGVRYDVERPYVWYADPKLREVIDRLDSQFPRRVHDVVDSSADLKTLIVQSSADTDLGTYYVYDVEKAKLSKLGSAYPELDQRTLGAMNNILYKAADGTEIPGYLTVPSGAEKKNLPLIVMPHDGPVARDSWRFNFLRAFLANRGYAVLQTNFRGSSGFGYKWQLDAHQDWGGLSYSDIQDATKWAVQEGIADPKRICVLGWGFGGYSALLSAARNSDTYRCAVSINGISDLESHTDQGIVNGSKEYRELQLGTDKAKLAASSPLKNAAQIKVPVLLVHGSNDWQVQEDQSKAMAKALERNKTPHELLLIKGAGHELERKSDRVTLLTEVEKFLSANIGAGTTN